MRRYKSSRLQGMAMSIETDIRELNLPVTQTTKALISPPAYLSNSNGDSRTSDINESLRLFWDEPDLQRENKAFLESIPRADFSAYPEEIRNGDWEYAKYKPNKDKPVNKDSVGCLTCHKKVEQKDYIFSFDELISVKK